MRTSDEVHNGLLAPQRERERERERERGGGQQVSTGALTSTDETMDWIVAVDCVATIFYLADRHCWGYLGCGCGAQAAICDGKCGTLNVCAALSTAGMQRRRGWENRVGFVVWSLSCQAVERIDRVVDAYRTLGRWWGCVLGCCTHGDQH